MLLILLPLCGNIDYCLDYGWWMCQHIRQTLSCWCCCIPLLDGILTPIAIGVFAQGEIKAYEIALCIIYAVNFIASYVCLKLGMAPETVFVLNIAFKACVLGRFAGAFQGEVCFSCSCFPEAMSATFSGGFRLIRSFYLFHAVGSTK